MTSKGTEAAAGQPNPECCMCGDHGFSDQLFQCKVCQFRSQHRYCSNLYPKAESYGTCNWCLSQNEDAKEKSPNSSNSSSSFKNNGDNSDQNVGAKKGLRGSARQLRLEKPIKKQIQGSPEAARSPPSTSQSPSVLVSTRKRIVTNGALEERLRRTRSEDIANNRRGVTKQVFRNKVRRYKLLDEVSS